MGKGLCLCIQKENEKNAGQKNRSGGPSLEKGELGRKKTAPEGEID